MDSRTRPEHLRAVHIRRLVRRRGSLDAGQRAAPDAALADSLAL